MWASLVFLAEICGIVCSILLIMIVGGIIIEGVASCPFYILNPALIGFCICATIILIDVYLESDFRNDYLWCKKYHPVKISFNTYLALNEINNISDFEWRIKAEHLLFVCLEAFEEPSSKNNYYCSESYYYFNVINSIKYILYCKRNSSFSHKRLVNDIQIEYTQKLQQMVDMELAYRREEQDKLLKENEKIIIKIANNY